MGEKQAPGSTAQRAAPEELRRRLALALDVDDLVVAHRLAKELRPWFGVAKVGLELYSATGPDVVVEFANAGYDADTVASMAGNLAGAWCGAALLQRNASWRTTSESRARDRNKRRTRRSIANA